MFELPEIVTLARQVTEDLTGARVASCVRGNTPHKWVWYTGEPEFYQAAAVGKTVGEGRVDGNRVIIPLEPGYELQVGDMGGKMLLHADGSTVPKKHHLLLGFEDGRFLSVAVQGWGGIWLFEPGGRPDYDDPSRVSPISDAFTYERFKELLAEDAQQGKRSVKAFMASRPRLAGIGNGYVQDVCFRAGLDPRREHATLSGQERQRWYRAIRKTLGEAIELGGRDTERDLRGQPGRYVAVMDQRAKGKPCPECGATIEKFAYLGGSCYVCPQCQR